MFGYRLIREADFTKLSDRREQLEETRAGLLGQIAQLTASAASKAAMVDLLTTRVNVLEKNAAMKAHAETGLPQHVAEIGRGTPLVSPGLGAGADLFEDVGDQRAEQLRAQGLLHDQDDMPLPTARDLVGSVGG